MSLHRVRSEIAADRAAYMYIGGATALIFALFGYVLGRHADELAELSETDALTQLLNARGFGVRLRAEIRRTKRYREPLSVLFLDLDGLKKINDHHGHRAGSEALRQVASVIRSELRATDTGARWGGDEFTIIAPNTKRDEAVSFAERIRARIAEHVADWPMTASIGIATLDDDDARDARGCAHAPARLGCGDVRSQAARKERRRRRTDKRRSRSRAVLSRLDALSSKP